MTSIAEKKLQEKYLQKLPEKMVSLNGFIATCDKLSSQSLLHKLAGSAGMYGFPAISKIASEIEDLIIAGESLNSANIKTSLKQLYNEIDQIKK